MLSLNCGVCSALIRHCRLDCNQDWSSKLFCLEIPIYKLATTSVLFIASLATFIFSLKKDYANCNYSRITLMILLST
jgi:hypothetical protein